MKTIFKVPPHHLIRDEHRIVFRHYWQGEDRYWFVPMFYVVSIKAIDKDGLVRIHVSSSYFQQGSIAA